MGGEANPNRLFREELIADRDGLERETWTNEKLRSSLSGDAPRHTPELRHDQYFHREPGP